MNGTVGKLAGDGPRTFVGPIGVVSVVRLDFGLLLLFAKKGVGGLRVECVNTVPACQPGLTCEWPGAVSLMAGGRKTSRTLRALHAGESSQGTFNPALCLPIA